MTPDELSRRVLENPANCPFCLSEDISAGKTDQFDLRSLTVHITCEKCAQEWEEVYSLVGANVERGGVIDSLCTSGLSKLTLDERIVLGLELL
jgi:hypothetical protein